MKIETRNKIVNLWPVACAIVGLLLLGTGKYLEINRETVQAEKHIKIVVATDRNCNDCHLGSSFVNLFSHAAVKGNDNIVNLIMDKTKIKRW
jgi:hypothetical protein